MMENVLLYNSLIIVYLNTDLNCFHWFQAVLVWYFSNFETRRRPRSRRGSRQVWYYVSHELRASLKIQHKDFGKQFLWTMCTGSCHVRHSYYIFSLETWFSYYVHDMKHDGHSMIILWNMAAMVRSWQDHDHEMTMIIVWSYYDHSMASMFGQPGQLRFAAYSKILHEWQICFDFSHISIRIKGCKRTQKSLPQKWGHNKKELTEELVDCSQKSTGNFV